MRRFAFHLTVALATFAISTFISIQIHHQFKCEFENANNNFVVHEKNELALTQLESENSENNLPPISERFTCVDKSLQPFWGKLRKHENFKDIEEFYKRVDWNNSNETYDCSYFFRVSDQIDLNHDGEKEVFVEGRHTGFCDMAGNGELYIFEKKNGRYQQILFNLASIKYRVKSSSTKGYFDIELRDNDRTGESGMWIYKFNGVKYRLNKSFTVISKVFKNGDVITLENPKIIRRK